MKFYDITQELFTCCVYPGDPAPERKRLRQMDEGARCNLTALSLCAHNGTHLDAPFHFINEGRKIDEIPLSQTVGFCYVAEHIGKVEEEDIRGILDRAAKAHPEGAKRILVKGEAALTEKAALVLKEANVVLYGNESQTVGEGDETVRIHQILLGADLVLLEGVRLAEVPEGLYWLSAAPLLLGGADGAPVRAYLVSAND